MSETSSDEEVGLEDLPTRKAETVEGDTFDEFIASTKPKEKKKKVVKEKIKVVKERKPPPSKNQILKHFAPLLDGYSSAYDLDLLGRKFRDIKDEKLMKCMIGRHTMGCVYDDATEQELDKVEG